MQGTLIECLAAKNYIFKSLAFETIGPRGKKTEAVVTLLLQGTDNLATRKGLTTPFDAILKNVWSRICNINNITNLGLPLGFLPKWGLILKLFKILSREYQLA